MKRILAAMIIICMMAVATGCATQAQSRGAATGGLVGGVAGALIDHRNGWRGGVIGAALGAILGATLADVADQAGREAYNANRPVEYRRDDERVYYRVDPVEESARTRCKKVKERVWEDDRLVSERTKEVCEGEKNERRY